MGIALVIKCAAKEDQDNAEFAIHFTVKALTSCTLLTRQSASALKVGLACGLRL